MWCADVALPATVLHMMVQPSELWCVVVLALKLCVAWPQLLPKPAASHDQGCMYRQQSCDTVLQEFLVKLLLTPRLAAQHSTPSVRGRTLIRAGLRQLGSSSPESSPYCSHKQVLKHAKLRNVVLHTACF